eukprot:4802-Pelagococcus_subviridis.AAC.2
METSTPSSSSTSANSRTTSTIFSFMACIAAPLIAHLSATSIIRRRFFASIRAVSSSLGGKKIANAALIFPQNPAASFASRSRDDSFFARNISARRPNVTSLPIGGAAATGASSASAAARATIATSRGARAARRRGGAIARGATAAMDDAEEVSMMI